MLCSCYSLMKIKENELLLRPKMSVKCEALTVIFVRATCIVDNLYVDSVCFGSVALWVLSKIRILIIELKINYCISMFN